MTPPTQGLLHVDSPQTFALPSFLTSVFLLVVQFLCALPPADRPKWGAKMRDLVLPQQGP
jgi:hypothetical protein